MSVKIQPVYVDFSARYRDVPDPIQRKVVIWLWRVATHERTVQTLTLIWSSIRFAAVALAKTVAVLIFVPLVAVVALFTEAWPLGMLVLALLYCLKETLIG